MAAKTPFDYAQMFRMFDPEDVSKYFDPTRMFSMFEPAKSSALDISGIMDSNKRNFEAMVEANKAAATAYQDLLQKQMDVFSQLTGAARDHMTWIDETTGPGAMAKKTEAYGEAVEKALVLMRRLAERARDANEEAYTALKSQVEEAMEEVQSKARPK